MRLFFEWQPEESIDEYRVEQQKILDKAIFGFRDIERADFEDNYNPNHREEQPF